MIEKKIFQEIPAGKEKFHSAVLTSFSFNFHHFEYQVVRTLRQKWISNIAVFVDQRMLNDSLGEVSGNLKQLSKSYSVTGVKATGAFHPKLNFLIGYDKLLLVFGSGNITPGGHGKNHELFTGFFADGKDAPQLPLIIEAWHYMKAITDDVSGYVSKQLNSVLPANCDLLRLEVPVKHTYHSLDKDTSISLVYNDETNIYKQLVELIPQEQVSSISVISPYYDEDGQSLLNLIDHFDKATMAVYLPSEGGLPPTNIPADSRITFYDWATTLRGKEKISGKNTYSRKLHSKIFHFKTDKFEYTMVGSANATVRALGSKSSRAANEEFGCLYRTRGKSMLQMLGITGDPVKLEVSVLKREATIIGDSGKSQPAAKIQISAADLSGYKLKLYRSKGIIDGGLVLNVSDSGGRVISQVPIPTNDGLIMSLEVSPATFSQNPTYVFITDAIGEVCSNKQPINFLNQLYRTDPSRGNRSLQEILTVLEAGEVNMYQIVEFLNKVRGSSNNAPVNSSSSGVATKESDGDSGLTYEQAVAALHDASRNEVAIRNYSSARIWEILNHVFQDKVRSVEDELMDEEEEGSAEIGRDREKAVSDHKPMTFRSKTQFDQSMADVQKMARRYISSLKALIKTTEQKRSHLDLCEFLLISHLLTVVCCFTSYEFEPDEKTRLKAKTAQAKRELHILSKTNWNQRFYELYEELMLECLENYCKLVLRTTVRDFSSDEDHLESEYNKYLKQANYHIALYLSILDRRTKYDIVRDKIKLVGLNLLKFHGYPDGDFTNYVKDMSRGLVDAYFDPDQVVKHAEDMISVLEGKELNRRYFELDNHGLCRMDGEVGASISFTSVFAPSRKQMIGKALLKKKGVKLLL